MRSADEQAGYMATITVILDENLAQRLIDDPTSWNYNDKQELLEAIRNALEDRLA